jgi:dihydroorotate dehydrogenase
LPHFTEAGGLSGAPIRSRATRVLQQLHSHLKNEVTLIGSGGIVERKDAAERIHAGAALVQLYTGLIYRGPRLIAECVSAFRGK